MDVQMRLCQQIYYMRICLTGLWSISSIGTINACIKFHCNATSFGDISVKVVDQMDNNLVTIPIKNIWARARNCIARAIARRTAHHPLSRSIPASPHFILSFYTFLALWHCSPFNKTIFLPPFSLFLLFVLPFSAFWLHLISLLSILSCLLSSYHHLLYCNLWH